MSVSGPVVLVLSYLEGVHLLGVPSGCTRGRRRRGLGAIHNRHVDPSVPVLAPPPMIELHVGPIHCMGA